MEFQGAKYKIPKSLSRVNDCPVAILESVNSVAAMMSFIHAPLLSPKVAIPPASLGHRYMTSAHPGLSALVLSACHTFFKPVLVSQNLRPIKCPLFQKHQLFWGHPPSQTGEWTSFRDCPPPSPPLPHCRRQLLASSPTSNSLRHSPPYPPSPFPAHLSWWEDVGKL